MLKYSDNIKKLLCLHGLEWNQLNDLCGREVFFFILLYACAFHHPDNSCSMKIRRTYCDYELLNEASQKAEVCLVVLQLTTLLMATKHFVYIKYTLYISIYIDM